jgi:hypothetical protein
VLGGMSLSPQVATEACPGPDLRGQSVSGTGVACPPRAGIETRVRAAGWRTRRNRRLARPASARQAGDPWPRVAGSSRRADVAGPDLAADRVLQDTGAVYSLDPPAVKFDDLDGLWVLSAELWG